jgi:hypothetical protein
LRDGAHRQWQQVHRRVGVGVRLDRPLCADPSVFSTCCSAAGVFCSDCGVVLGCWLARPVTDVGPSATPRCFAPSPIG